MVACDSCLSWHHYTCAKVDAGVKDYKWYCQTCESLLKIGKETDNSKKLLCPPKTDVKGAKPKSKQLATKSVASSRVSRRSKKTADGSITSSTKARLEQELQAVEEMRRIEEEALEEEKKLNDLQQKCEEELRTKALELEARRIAEAKAMYEKMIATEREFRRQQMAIRKHSAEEKVKLIRQASQYGSSRDSVSVADSREKVKDWLEQTNQQIKGTQNPSQSAVNPTNDPKQVPLESTNTKSLLDKLDKASEIPNPNKPPPKQKLPLKSPVSKIQEKFNQKIESNKRNSSKTRKPLRPSGLSGTGKKASGTGDGQVPDGGVDDDDQPEEQLSEPGQPEDENENNDISEGPTSRQLAARQVMGKDLPPFSGSPEEWPIWISNFQRSTTTCDFSDDENLIRLQRCLKGPALEAVRSRLLCPASVPHVIKALEMRYGRPETLIRSMTERVRRLPLLKANDLESIIDFGLAVDNLVQHFKNVGYQAHLSNPSLLHDLVRKLPVDYRLKWASIKSETQDVDLSAFGTFMSGLVELAYNVADDFPSTKPSKPKVKERSFVQTHTEAESSSKNEPASNNSSSRRTPKKKRAWFAKL